MQTANAQRHGHRKSDAKGGRSPTYVVWEGMVQRCTDSGCAGWKNYGGRGIGVCDRWRDFTLFLADMGERPSRAHSIDRVDGTRGYEPGNCRWATATEQANNRWNNRRITFRGETLTVAEWSRRTGLAQHLIGMRVRHGWPAELALTRPSLRGWRGANPRRKAA